MLRSLPNKPMNLAGAFNASLRFSLPCTRRLIAAAAFFSCAWLPAALFLERPQVIGRVVSQTHAVDVPRVLHVRHPHIPATLTSRAIDESK